MGDKQIRIAYETSFGDDSITDIELEKYLNRFDLLTVREEISSEKLINDYMVDVIRHCCRSVWNGIALL